MTCSHCIQEVELLLSGDELTAALRTHLDSCEECASYWKQQTALFDELGDESLFDVDTAEIDSLVDRVNARLNAQSHDSSVDDRKIISVPRMRRLGSWVAAAAALVAMVGTGLVVQDLQQQSPAIATVSQADEADLFDFAVEGTDTTLGDTTVTALLYDYAQNKPYSASEELLSNISDEEWQYLESEFDLGGL